MEGRRIHWWSQAMTIALRHVIFRFSVTGCSYLRYSVDRLDNLDALHYDDHSLPVLWQAGTALLPTPHEFVDDSATPEHIGPAFRR
jgi:hypothetical protein